MKRNNFMFIGGLLLVIGSTFILPFIGIGATVLLGEDFIDKLLSVNRDSLPAVIVVVVGAAVLLPVTGMFLLFGSILIPFFSSRRAKNKILAEGQTAEARILALDDTGTRINNDPLVSFTLEVYPPAQPPFRAEVRQTVSVIHLPSYQPGKIVGVKYMPGTRDVAITGAKYV